MPVVRNAGLRSDGELVQALSDTFDFTSLHEKVGLLLPAVQSGDVVGRQRKNGADSYAIEISVESAGDDDDGLPDTIIWCIAGDGEGQNTIEIALDLADRSWSVDGLPDGGFAALLGF